MKRIIILGACLVTAAIVYGVVDFVKTDKKKLDAMYRNEAVAVAPVKVKPTETAAVDTAPSNLNLELYSRSRPARAYKKHHVRSKPAPSTVAVDTAIAVVDTVARAVPANRHIKPVEFKKAKASPSTPKY